MDPLWLDRRSDGPLPDGSKALPSPTEPAGQDEQAEEETWPAIALINPEQRPNFHRQPSFGLQTPYRCPECQATLRSQRLLTQVILISTLFVDHY